MGRKPKPAEVRVRFFTARSSGATLNQAAAAAGVSRITGHYWLAQSGGVRPRLTRPRPKLRLSMEERETISRGLAKRQTLTAIAAELGRSVSTVSREIARNSGVDGYRAARVDRIATARTARPRAGKLAGDPTLRRIVEEKRPSRSAGASARTTRSTRRCGCRTRRSTRRCSCRPKACYAGC